MTPYTPPRWAASPPSPRTLKIVGASIAVAAGLVVAGGVGVEPMAGAFYGVLPACTVESGTEQTLVVQVRGVSADAFCDGMPRASRISGRRVDGRIALCTLYKNGNRIRLYASADIAGLIVGGLACPLFGTIIHNN